MMPALLTIAFLLPIPIFRSGSSESTNQDKWIQLVAAFEKLGIFVITDHPRCQEPNLYGLYVRGGRQVVVCPRGDMSSTLRHEGWHAVQTLCLRDRAWLSLETRDAKLTKHDQAELYSLVSPPHRDREAEARAMMNMQNKDYLQAVETACKGNEESNWRIRPHSRTFAGPVHTQVRAMPLAERKGAS